MIRGTVQSVLFQNPENGYSVLKLRTEDGELVTVVGTIPMTIVGERLVIAGRWGHHPSHGPQFEAEFLERLMPETKAEIFSFLSSRAVKGIGEKTAAKYADELIVLSEGTRDYFKETYGRETFFIPNGIDVPNEKKADIITKKYGLKKDGYILFLARIVPEKGLHYLIDAFMQTDTDKKLVIAGGVSHSSEYAKQIHDMAKDDRIIFTGFVEGDELWELYYNCRMYVLPSDVEGMPISLLEAMACGCECLVSNIDTAKNVVGEYGYTFKKSDVNDLKSKLCEMLGKQKADKAEQIEYVKNNYSWDEITDRTLELYKK